MISAANEKAAALFGVPVVDLVGKQVSRHFPAGYEDELLAKYADVRGVR